MPPSSSSAVLHSAFLPPSMASLVLLLLPASLLFHADPVLGQHKSFGETKFDLPADLPAEDSLPPLANSQDTSPFTVAAPSPPVPASESPTSTSAVATALVVSDPSPTTLAAAPPPAPPITVPQPTEPIVPATPAQPLPSAPPTTGDVAVPLVASFPPPVPSASVPSSVDNSIDATTGTPNSKTPLPSLPSLIELPNFVENGHVQPITIAPSLIESNNDNSNNNNGTSAAPNTASSSARQQQQQQQSLLPSSPALGKGIPPQPQVVPSAKVPPLRTTGVGIGAIQQQRQQLPKDGQKIVVRSKEWFREEFDVRNCSKSSEILAKAIRAKFPRNLLRHGKDAVLAELLGTRLAECLRKQSENHWARLDKQLKRHNNELDRNERDECRAGLVEEQIACMNIYSFTCQFVQPSFLFRLLPTRIIVQEGRIAEEGAEKCQKFAQKFSAHQHERSR